MIKDAFFGCEDDLLNFEEDADQLIGALQAAELPKLTRGTKIYNGKPLGK